jgi:hypothetical protein
MGKDSEREFRGLIEVLSRNLPGETEGNPQKISVSIADVLPEI